jgi:hypothetical protein
MGCGARVNPLSKAVRADRPEGVLMIVSRS